MSAAVPLREGESAQLAGAREKLQLLFSEYQNSVKGTEARQVRLFLTNITDCDLKL